MSPGTPMILEDGNVIPVVMAKLADGTTIRGVTLPAMIGEAAEASQSNVQPPQPKTDAQADSGPDEAKETANVQRIGPIVAQASARAFEAISRQPTNPGSMAATKLSLFSRRDLRPVFRSGPSARIR